MIKREIIPIFFEIVKHGLVGYKDEVDKCRQEKYYCKMMTKG